MVLVGGLEPRTFYFIDILHHELNSFMVCPAGGSFHCLPSVRELDLSCNKRLSGGLIRLTSHLAHLSHLEVLDLHLCCLTPADVEALSESLWKLRPWSEAEQESPDLLSSAQVLPSLPALVELDVSSNKEAGRSLHQLVSALQLTQMRRLPLSSCRLDEESFPALGEKTPTVTFREVLCQFKQ